MLILLKDKGWENNYVHFQQKKKEEKLQLMQTEEEHNKKCQIGKNRKQMIEITLRYQVNFAKMINKRYIPRQNYHGEKEKAQIINIKNE